MKADVDKTRLDQVFNLNESGDKWGPSLNWHQIDEQLYRMMEKARYYDSEGEFDAAASIASEIVSL